MFWVFSNHFSLSHIFSLGQKKERKRKRGNDRTVHPVRRIQSIQRRPTGSLRQKKTQRLRRKPKPQQLMGQKIRVFHQTSQRIEVQKNWRKCQRFKMYFLMMMLLSNHRRPRKILQPSNQSQCVLKYDYLYYYWSLVQSDLKYMFIRSNRTSITGFHKGIYLSFESRSCSLDRVQVTWGT